MPLAAIRAYMDQLPRHRAQYQVMLIHAACFPHYDEQTAKQEMNVLLNTIQQPAGEPAQQYQSLAARATVVSELPFPLDTTE